MTNKFKQQFLEQGHFDMLIEDIVYQMGLSANLEEDEMAEIIDKMYDKHKLADLYFNTFRSFMGGEEKLQKYIETELVAREAFDSFIKRATECLVEEVNEFLPKEQQIEYQREKLH